MKIILILIVLYMLNDVEITGKDLLEPIETTEDEDIDFFAFVCKVLAGGNLYPAILVNGGAIVTTRKLEEAGNVSVCYRDHFCQRESEIVKTPKETGLTYVKGYIGPYYASDFRSYVLGMSTTPENCLSVAFDHRPVNVSFELYPLLAPCHDCRYLDGLFCDGKFVGVLIYDRLKNFVVLKYEDILQFVEEHVMNDTTIMLEYPDVDPFEPLEEKHSSSGVRFRLDLSVVSTIVWIYKDACNVS